MKLEVDEKPKNSLGFEGPSITPFPSPAGCPKMLRSCVPVALWGVVFHAKVNSVTLADRLLYNTAFSNRSSHNLRV